MPRTDCLLLTSHLQAPAFGPCEIVDSNSQNVRGVVSPDSLVTDLLLLRKDLRLLDVKLKNRCLGSLHTRCSYRGARCARNLLQVSRRVRCAKCAAAPCQFFKRLIPELFQADVFLKFLRALEGLRERALYKPPRDGCA